MPGWLSSRAWPLTRSDAPTLDDDVNVRQVRPDPDEAAAVRPQRPRRNQHVAVEIDLGNQLKVRGRGLDTTLGGQPRPEQRWPTADTPIDGLIEAHVANLGVWGRWGRTAAASSGSGLT